MLSVRELARQRTHRRIDEGPRRRMDELQDATFDVADAGTLRGGRQLRHHGNEDDDGRKAELARVSGSDDLLERHLLAPWW